MRLTALQQLYVKKQSGAGVYAWPGVNVPIAGELLEAYEVSPPKIEGETLERSGNARGAHTPLPARPGPRHYSATASVDIVLPISTALMEKYHAPSTPFRNLLEAADLVCTTKTPTLAEYKPVSNNGTLLSVWHYFDGLIYKAVDCKVGFIMSSDAGGLWKVAMTISGRYYDTVTGAMSPVTATSFANAETAELAGQVDLEIGGVAYPMDFARVELQWQPTVKQRKGHKGKYGEIGTIITNRAPKIVMTPDMNDTFDIAAIVGWDAATMCRLLYQTQAANGGTMVLIAGGQVVQTPPEDEDGEGRHNMEMRMSAETVETELTLRFNYLP
jgi:hypothetical protein